MVKFIIDIVKAEPKNSVTVQTEEEVVFSGRVKVTPEQLLDNLTRFFLGCVREDISNQQDIEKKELGIWRE